ncbi:MAG: hypothetical protein HW386_843 [Gammaproteobacteria bacterium]|nr:hypothetical protein [Gammaproteobacteria bacterium]
MQSQIDKKNKAVVLRITIAQFAVTLLITLVLYVLVDFQAAYSGFLAGMISTLATLYIGSRFFFSPVRRAARDRLASIYMAELIKIVFVVVAFCASFLLLKVHFLAFIGAYLATVAVYWLAMIWPAFGVQIKTINLKG